VFWNLLLTDSSGGVFADDSPPTSLSLSDFDDALVTVQFDALGGFVQGSITRFSLPEPGAVGLLLIGLLGLALRPRAITARSSAGGRWRRREARVRGRAPGPR
jgi:hypothetical protein